MLDAPTPQDDGALPPTEATPAHDAVLYATSTDDPTLQTRLDPLADSLDDAADITINHVIADPGSHQSNHGNTGYGEDDDHANRADLKTRARSRTRG